MPPHLDGSQIRLIVFDLDGVITDERPYWDSAREAVREIQAGLVASRSVCEGLPESLLYWLKNRAVNSNWDVAFVAVCAALYSSGRDLDLVALGRIGARFPNGSAQAADGVPHWSGRQQGPDAFFDPATPTGAELIRYAGVKLASVLPPEIRYIVEYGGPLWDLCQRRCQEIHNFRMLSGTAKHTSVLGQERVVEILSELRVNCGCCLGVATGRPKQEAMDALNDLGLLPFFDPNRIVTHNDVADAQRILGTSGKPSQLGKPHPFILLRAIYPDLALHTLLGQSIVLENHAWVAFVGDTLSDVLAAKAARAWSLCVVGAVANPVARQERREQLLASGCDLVLDSIAELPPVMLSNHQRTGWNEKHS